MIRSFKDAADRVHGPRVHLDADGALKLPVPSPLESDQVPVRIAVVIPAFRVAAHVERVIRGIPALVSDIIVIDDASPDETSRIVTALSDPRVHLLRHEQNGGVGAAMISGYRHALALGADVVVKMDGDDQMDPAHLPSLIEPITAGEADYTKGSRFFYTRQLRQMPLVRRIGNLGLSFLTKASSGYGTFSTRRTVTPRRTAGSSK